MTNDQRKALIEPDDKKIPLKTQAELLSLNRSSLYYRAIPPSEREIKIKHRIDEIYTAYPFYGYRRITAILNQEAIGVSRNTVQKYMREIGIQAIHPGPNLSKRNLQHRIYPYLLNGLKIARPNQVWATDITYIRLKHGWMYLAAVIDLYSRYVLSWELDQNLSVELVLKAIRTALITATPEIINSDQGSQYTSLSYIELLKEGGIKISMDSKGRATDNVFVERLWRSLKYEEVYLKDYQTPREARLGIARYFEFYNYQRPHQSLNYQVPAALYYAETNAETNDLNAGQSYGLDCLPAGDGSVIPTGRLRKQAEKSLPVENNIISPAGALAVKSFPEPIPFFPSGAHQKQGFNNHHLPEDWRFSCLKTIDFVS